MRFCVYHDDVIDLMIGLYNDVVISVNPFFEIFLKKLCELVANLVKSRLYTDKKIYHDAVIDVFHIM